MSFGTLPIDVVSIIDPLSYMAHLLLCIIPTVAMTTCAYRVNVFLYTLY